MINETPTLGTGMLAMFVNLAPQWRGEFRDWLQADMFAARLGIGFHACASYDVISGSHPTQARPQQFLTVYSMANVGCLYAEPYQALRRSRDQRDALFHERFTDVERYTLGWVGPEIARSDSEFDAIVHVDRFDLAPEQAQDFNSWFVTQYLPTCNYVKGLTRLRRYTPIEGQPGVCLFHEFSSLDTLADEDWQRIRNDTMWSRIDTHDGGCASYRRVIRSSS